MDSSRKVINTFYKTASGKADFNKIQWVAKDLSDAKSNYVSFNEGNISQSDLSGAELSFCEFHGASFKQTYLNRAIMIGTSFSSSTDFTQADVNGCLLLLAICDDKIITNDWLKKRGAKNSTLAITNISTLNSMLNTLAIDLETAQHYKDELSSACLCLKAIQKMKEENLTMSPGSLALLKYCTPVNFAVLMQARIDLDTYISKYEEKPYKSPFKF